MFGTYSSTPIPSYPGARLRPREPWVRWFAWYPVKVHGNWVWFKIVYRRELPKSYSDFDDWICYEYGNLFDVLKS